MLSALRFNYNNMPSQMRLPMGFMHERRMIYQNMVHLIQGTKLGSHENWMPLNSMLQQYMEVYQLQIEERQELLGGLIERVFVREEVNSVPELQNLLQIMVRLADSKQKYFAAFRVDHLMLHTFMEKHFLSNENRTIVSQTYTTSMFHEFCQFVKCMQYFFDASAIAFAFQMFKENLGSTDKQLAWAYLSMFCPVLINQLFKFRHDIPGHLYEGMLDYVVEAEIFDSGEKENCRLRFILNYMRQQEIVPHVFKIIHGILRVDSNAEEKGENLLNVMLPDEVIDIESVYKIIPKLIVEMMGSSTRPGYDDYMLQLKRVFQLFDSIMSVYNSQTWDDTLFKMIKLLVANFIYKYRHDDLVRKVLEIKNMNTYDENVAKELIEELVKEFEGSDIVDYLESDRHYMELFCVNPDQGYPDPEFKQRVPLKFHYNDITPTLLDSKAKDDFISLILGVMDKIVFMEDNGISIVKTALFLCQFEPKTIDFFMKRMDIAFSNPQEVASPTLKNILILISNPTLLSKNQYQLKDLFKYMELSFKLFEIRGVQENVDSIEFYERVMLNTCCVTPEELIKLYPQCEGTDAITASEFLSEFVLDVFKLVIKNMHILKYKENENSSILLNLSTLFWSLVCNCSDGVINSVVDTFLTHIERELDATQFFFMGDLLDCLVYKCPQRMIPSILDLVFEKLIRDRTKPLQPHFFTFLIEQNSLKDEILKYEASHVNNSTKKLWLTLLEKTLSQASSSVKLHIKKLTIIIMYYLQEDEDEIFEKTCDIVHSIAITNLLIVPKDFRSHRNLIRPDFYLKSDDSVFKDFGVDWRFPDQEDWKFSESFLNTYFFSVKQRFEDEYFATGAFTATMPQDFSKLANQILFQTPSLDPKLKQKCYRMWFVMFATFSGCSMFIPLSKPDLDIDESIAIPVEQLYTKVQQEYFKQLNLFGDLRPKIADFVSQAIVMAIQTGIVHDTDLNEMLFYMCSQTVGSSVLNQDIQMSKDYLSGARSLNITTRNRVNFENRMELISEQLISINTSIQLYAYRRHFLLMHLQGAPTYFTQLYNYVMVLALARSGDVPYIIEPKYQFPGYLLPFSKRITHELTFSIRSMLLDYVCEVLDYTNPKSQLSLINAAPPHEKSKGYKILSQLLKALFQSCENIPPNLGLDLRLHKKQHFLINAINPIENKVCKQLLFDACVKMFILAYDENTFPYTEEDVKLRLEMMEMSATQLVSPDIFWKCKLVHSLIILNNFNYLLRSDADILHNSALIELVVEAFKVNCLCDNIHLNSIGRVGLFYLMREAKRCIYRKTQRDSSPLTPSDLETFLTWRFLPQEEVLAIKNSYAQLDSMDDLLPGLVLQRAKNPDHFLLTAGKVTQTEILHVDNEQQFSLISRLVKVLRRTFADQTFTTAFLERILVDKDVQPTHEFSTSESVNENQEVQFMNARGILKYIQILLSYIYIKDKKKNSPFSCTQSFFMADFYSRFFKKIFQVCGKAFFTPTKPIIDEYSKQLDQKEKQRLTAYFIGGLSRSLLPVGTYAQDLLVQMLPYISQEVFTENHVILYYICKNQDWAWMERFIRPCLDCCKKFSGDTGVRGFRYLHLLKIVIETQVTRAYHLRAECFQHLEILFPTSGAYLSSTHIDENVSFLAVFLLVTLCFPIPIEVAPKLTNNMIQMSKHMVFSNDENAQLFFNKMNSMLQQLEGRQDLTKQEQEVQRVQSELAVKLLEQIYIKKVNQFSWNYIKQAMSTIFENNLQNVEVDTMEILRKQVSSEFSPDVSDQLLQMLARKANSDNWQTRKKANLFLRDWYFLDVLCNKLTTLDVPILLLKCIDDKHPQLQLQALHSVADYFKVYLPQELTEKFKTVIKYGEDLSIAILMSMLLSRMDRTFEWTDEALSRVLKAYQRMPNRKKLIQEFVSEYWKTRQDNLQVFEYQICEENLQMLREIVNPYSYFA